MPTELGGHGVEEVAFIMVERGDDLIVSFAIGADPTDIKSLILLRTPKYESFLDADERGVTVSLEPYVDDERDLLQAIGIGAEVVEMITQRRRYALNIRNVDADDITAAKRVLKQMNFDRSFELSTAEG